MDRNRLISANYAKYLALFLFPCFYFLIPGVQEFVQEGIQLLHHHDVKGLRALILSYGWLAPFMAIFLMIVQSIFPFVPGMLMTMVNAWIFGWLAGAVYTWLGAFCGAALDFALSRWFGRPLVVKLISPAQLNRYGRMIREYGLWAVLLARITPVIPFKVISFGAGLTQLTWRDYLLATAIGQTLPILLYSFLGQTIFRNFAWFVGITLLFIVLVLLIYRYRRRFSGLLRFFRQD